MVRAFLITTIIIIGILALFLLRVKNRSLFLEEAAVSKDRQIESLAANIAEANKKNTELQQQLAGLSKYRYIEDVLQWANNAKSQIENYMKEASQYADSLIRNAEIEAEKKISHAVEGTVPEMSGEAAALAERHAAALIGAAEAQAEEIKKAAESRAAEQYRLREEEIASRLARLKEREEAIARTERGLLAAISEMIRSAEEQARLISPTALDEQGTFLVGSDSAADRTAI